MSISSMVRSKAVALTAVARRTPPATPRSKTPVERASDSAEQLARYIPTEVVTVYVAIVAAQQQAAASEDTKWVTFWIMLGLTPVVTWLLLAIRLRASKMPLPINPKQWPYWKAIAACIAFTAWAFALPETPFKSVAWYADGAYGSPVLLATTVLLGLLGGLFDPIP